MKRETSVDIIRILAIFIIVNFHFAYTTGNEASFFFAYANGGWGSTGVTIFFMISGFLLYRGYSHIDNIKSFYKKRLLSVYPLMWLSFLAAFLVQSAILGTFDRGIHPLSIIYTILGCDTYIVYFGIPTFALVGEWFTLIIILLYLLYPLILRLFQRAFWPSSIIILALWILINIYNPFPVPADANLLTGILCFWIGMIIANPSPMIYNRRWFCLIFAAIGAICLFIYIPFIAFILKRVLGICIFMFFYILLDGVHIKEKPGKALAYLSGLTYSIYLNHHFIVTTAVTLLAANFTDPSIVIPFYLIYMIIMLLWSMGLQALLNLLKRPFIKRS